MTAQRSVYMKATVSVSVFEEFHTSNNKTFILTGGMGTNLSFYEV